MRVLRGPFFLSFFSSAPPALGIFQITNFIQPPRANPGQEAPSAVPVEKEGRHPIGIGGSSCSHPIRMDFSEWLGETLAEILAVRRPSEKFHHRLKPTQPQRNRQPSSLNAPRIALRLLTIF